ncbi:flagellar hook-associated protein FlgL [Modestobacter sp. NPDC049651]|uniref:flagellar hook-associated protein FlgL n=1 Tax=unclassified Modestobacter TaxID=2643866 RepID=UPI0033D4C055
MMRITQRAISLTSLQGLNANLSAVNRLQEQLTSGKKISRPSDSPTGTNAAMLTRADLASTDQQARNISDATTFLDSADTALQNMMTQTQRIRDLTVQALNTGALSSESQGAIAAEVRQLRESLLGQANTVVQGRPIFGGVTAGRTAYDAAGGYVGVGGTATVPVYPVTRQVSDVEQVRVDVTGPEAFGPNGSNLFDVVGDIATHVAAGDATSLTADLDALDAAFSRMSDAVADLGARQARIEKAGTINQSRQLSLTARQTDVEDIDMPKTIMELNMQKTGYQAALQATAQALQPTLLDFLR